MKWSARNSSIFLALLLVAGCASNRPEKIEHTLQRASSPAWSLKLQNDEIVVAVSPTGKALRIVGSSGLVVGAVIDANVNARFREKILAALSDYNPSEVLEDRFTKRMEMTFGERLSRIAPLGSTAGFHNEQEALEKRLKRLEKKNIDALLDLNTTYGIYGPDAILAMRVSGNAYGFSSPQRLWRKTIVTTYGEILADFRAKDPTDLVKPDISSGLTVEEHAIEALIQDEGAFLKTAFDDLCTGTIAAVLCDIGIDTSPEGYYYLGKSLMLRGKYHEADACFVKALNQRPEWLSALNSHAVAVARSGNVEGAIAITEDICRLNPEYSTGWYKLAYWYALETKEYQKARECYQKSLQLKGPPNQKIERVLGLEQPSKADTSKGANSSTTLRTSASHREDR